MLLVARVRRTLVERALLVRGTTVIVGVSGGPDSTALLDVLARLRGELGIALVAVGVDHGLRAAAAAELDLAEATARARDVVFERVRVSLGAGSVHAAARSARYEALHAAAHRHGASAVAVGHTLDDQAETVLARILHGAGLHGLGGIDPARADGVVRPLIDARRDEIRAYVAEMRLACADDPSNTDPRFERSRIRENVLPALTIETPEAIPHLAWLADEAREADALLDTLAARLLADATTPDGIVLASLRAAPRVVAIRALRRALGPEIGRAHLSELASRLQEPSEAADVRLPGARTARIVEDHLVLLPLGRTDPDEEA